MNSNSNKLTTCVILQGMNVLENESKLGQNAGLLPFSHPFPNFEEHFWTGSSLGSFRVVLRGTLVFTKKKFPSRSSIISFLSRTHINIDSASDADPTSLK